MSLKGVGGKAIVYAAANGIGSAAQLLLILYCAYILPGEALGVLTLFVAIVALATQVLGLGLVASFQRDFFVAQAADRPLYLSSVIWVVLGAGAVLLLLLAVVLSITGQALSFPPSLVVIAFAGALGQAIQQFLLVIWQSEDAPAPYARYMLGFCLLQVVVPMGFIQLAGHYWESAVYGQALVFVLGGLLSLQLLWRKGYLRAIFSASYLRSALSFGLPLVPYQLAGWGMAMLDRFIITSFAGVAIAGYYSLAFQVSQLINIVSSGFNQAFTPWLYAVLGGRESTQYRQISVVVAGYSIGLVVICLVGYLCFSLGVTLLGKESYQQAFVFAPWLFLAMFFNGLYRVASSFILYRGKTGSLALMIVGVAALSALLNYLLVPLHGAIAAAWVVTFSFGLLFVVTVLMGWAKRRV